MELFRKKNWIEMIVTVFVKYERNENYFLACHLQWSYLRMLDLCGEIAEVNLYIYFYNLPY